MNKKGFTLIELLAVIVILAVVMLIGGISISSIKNKMDQKMFEEKLSQIVIAAKAYGNDNKAETSVTVGKLQSDKYLDATDDDLKHFLSGKDLKGMTITISLRNNRIYACIDKNTSTNYLNSGSFTVDDIKSVDIFC